MGEVVDDFAARGVSADEVTPELEHIWWVSIAHYVADSDPRYGQHDGTGLRSAAEGYASADREHLAQTARRTRVEAAAWHSAALDANRTAAAMLRAEADKSGRPISLQRAFESAADLLVGSAPCWAMSPLVVGEALPPGSSFDVVVVAGAGSLTTAAAVSALSRGRQVVAVGDPESTWPTGFTAGPGGLAEDPAPRSLLEDLSGILPVHRLRWTHGYADPRLLDVAGVVGGGYASGFVAPPSNRVDAVVGLEIVDGRAALDPGEDATIDSTDAEVDRVVALVLDHARTRPAESLGVIALTERHAERVRSALAASAGALDPAAEAQALAFLSAEAARPVVVVPMGAASGVTRDAVIVTVGYGKTAHGRVLHRFPALSSPDASRQLRATLTAARRRLTVVTAIAPEELDESRLRDGGVVLRDLLLAAASGAVPGAIDDPVVTPDPLMTELAGRLRREGLLVREHVGTGPHRVDLAVTVPVHPERWLVAVDGDGPAYATWRGTRERDRLWPQELERRGWRHLRVWSTDLYRDPAREVARIVTAVREEARALAGPSLAVPLADETATGSAEPTSGPAAAGLTPADETSPDETSANGTPADQTPAEKSVADQTSDEEPLAEPPAAELPAADETPAEGGTGSTRRRRGFRRATAGPTTPAASTPSDDPAGSAEPAGQTVDDTDAGWGDQPDDRNHEQWLREQRPPHWD